MLESIIETRPFDFAAVEGDITIANGATAATGSGFSNLSVLDIIEVTNDDGNVQHFQVSAIADDNNMTVSTSALAAITAKSYRGATPQCDFFMVDNTKLKMPIILGGSETDDTNAMFTAGGLSNISPHEGLGIKSIYTRLPYQFTFADNLIDLAVFTTESTANIAESTSLGENDGAFALPVENSEVEVNIYNEPDSNALSNGTRYEVISKYLYALTGPVLNPPNTIPSGFEPSVSMVNVPDALNGTIQPAIIGMRILHASEPMT